MVLRHFVMVMVLAVPFTSTVYAADARSFPPAIGGARPVSDVAVAVAAGAQTNPYVASNGASSLAIWSHNANARWQVRAAPIDGGPHDPVGLAIDEDADPKGVYWNGSHFAAITWNTLRNTRIRLTEDGAVIDRADLSVPPSFKLEAIASDGRNLLFVEFTPGSATRVIVTDSLGEARREPVILPTSDGRVATKFAAGAGSGEFLVLRYMARAGDEIKVVADRIGIDGSFISSVDSGMPRRPDVELAIAGGAEGYAVVAQMNAAQLITAYRLDPTGAYSGEVQIAPADRQYVQQQYKPVIVRDGARYVVAWHAISGYGWAEVRVTDLPIEVTSATTRVLVRWPGGTGSVALAVQGGRPLVVAGVSITNAVSGQDLYLLKDAGGLPLPPQLLTYTAVPQRDIQAAAYDGGFVLMWSELTPEGFDDAYLIRTTRSGLPLDAGPLVIDRARRGEWDEFRVVGLTASGNRVLSVWMKGSRLYGRRLDIPSGAWIDDEPFVIGDYGTTAHALTADARGTAIIMRGTSANSHPLAFLRIPWDEDSLAGEPVELSRPPRSLAFSIASDGAGYLVVWAEADHPCQYECIYEPSRIAAARLTAEGQLLDAVPIVLEEGTSYGEWPSVSWSHDRYLVAWSGLAWYGEDENVVYEPRGATISRNGVVIDANSASVPGIPLRPEGADVLNYVITMSDGDFFVVVSSLLIGGYPNRWYRIDAVRFPHDAPLRSVASLVPRVIMPEDSLSYWPAVAAGSGRYLLGWIQPGEGLADGVLRGHFQLFGENNRQRAVRR